MGEGKKGSFIEKTDGGMNARRSLALPRKTRRLCRLWAALLAAVLLLLPLTGCETDQKTEVTEGLVIFCLDDDAESLEKEALTLSAETTDDKIREISLAFHEQVTSEAHLRLLPVNVKILSFSLNDQILTLDFSDEYLTMPKTREVLVRAGIVRTFVQLDEVQKVAFTIERNPLTDSRERKIGNMTADTFIENSGKEINNYRSATISLFYASEDGLRLRRENRLIYYTSSQPLEWAIVERIISGPKVQGNFATVPPATQIISVATSEGICYVNLGAQFNTEVQGVDPRITIYSIVNTLIEDCGVQAVQISIAGDSDVLYCGKIPLNQPFTADTSLLEN